MSKNNEEKVYIVDTSVLLNDPMAIDRLLPGNVVIIPIWVIEELDHKKHQDENARMASRIIDQYGEKATRFESLDQGVKTPDGGKLIVEYRSAPWSELPDGIEKNNDNRILLVAKHWQKKGSTRIIVLSCDTNLRIKAKTFKIEAQNYHFDEITTPTKTAYSGTAKILLKPEQAGLLQEINMNRLLPVNRLNGNAEIAKLYPNQCCFLICGDKYQLTVYDSASAVFKPVAKPRREDKGKTVQPVNDEQAFAYNMLLNPDIKVVTLVGPAGTGKTLISLRAAYDQLGLYHQILVYRPNIELGQQIGFLPGEISDKFQPWMAPIYDNMQLIVSGQQKTKSDSRRDNEEEPFYHSQKELVDDLIKSDQLVIEPINFVRGRSLNHVFIIIDEGQNLTRHEVKTIISRVGLGSKIVLVGDPTQIDNPRLTSISNGLVRVVEAFKGQVNFGHMILIRGERSEVADQAAKLL